jgi:hypothetical protein
MDFSDVYLVSPKLQTVEQSRLDELETWLKHPLPLGYREYMSQLGVGKLCNHLYLDSPEAIQEKQDDHREYIDFHYEEFFEDQLHILSFEDALNSIHVASSTVGDIIVYTPELDGKLYVLERYVSDIYTIEGGFFTPFQWTHPEKPLMDFSLIADFLYFTPTIDRAALLFSEVENCDLDALIQHVLAFWDFQETYVNTHTYNIDIFCRGCDGIVSLARAENKNSVRLSIKFDKDHTAIVQSFVQTLEPWGFVVMSKEDKSVYD